MKEIPMIYVKSNQIGIVLSIVLAILFQEPIILAVLWLIQIVGLIFGGRTNLFIQFAKQLFHERAKTGEKQAFELQRFNNVLGVLFLTLSLGSFLIGWELTGYIFSSFLLIAALVAILGYCIGCTIYYQLKQLKHRISKS